MSGRATEVSSDLLPAAPAVSVLLITYNHERFIAQAIESVLCQTTQFDFELVIGDDFSTDMTRQIVQEYQVRYPGRIRLLLQPRNVGPDQNVRRGLRACRGKYIAQLEGDDYWIDANKLQLQYDAMEANPRALCCGARALVWQDGEANPRGIAPEGDAAVLASYGAKELVRGLWWFRTCTKMFPAEHLRRLPLRVTGDWASTLWLIATTANAEIAFVDRVVGVYRLHSGGSYSTTSNASRMATDVRILFHVIPVFRGDDRQFLIDTLHRRVDNLLSDREATPGAVLRSAALAALRCPWEVVSWKHLANGAKRALHLQPNGALHG